MKKIIFSLILSIPAVSHAESVTDKLAEQVFNKLDEYCAGNSNGGVSRFNVEKFNAKKAQKQIMQAAGSCKDMKHSTSKEDATNAFISYFNNSHDDYTNCAKDNLTDTERRVIINVVTDPDNVAVFSNQYDDKDESERCYFHHFDIYRASGQKISVVHDETD